MTAPARDYRASVEREHHLGITTEHSFRAALKTFLEEERPGVVATNEPRRVACGAPDFVVSLPTTGGPRTIGHIETKDLGADLNAIENSDQIKRYRESLPNLILTNYLEFRWYVDGDPRLSASAGALDGGRVRATRTDGDLDTLLAAFLNHRPAPVVDPRDLAERMARLTHLIREAIISSFANGTASSLLRDLRGAFSEILLPDLTVGQFADMFAQTLAYGLFAARVRHEGHGEFRRSDAAREIPRSNPFLRRLFTTITGPDLDDEPFVGYVDDLVQLLAEADFAAILAQFGARTRQTDPIVHFYETFLAAYDPALREARGVYYTPEPVVSYLVRSVDGLLRTEFGLQAGIADTARTTYQADLGGPTERTVDTPRVLILDPACGTGTFLYWVIDYIRSSFRDQHNAGMWPSYVREDLIPRLMGFELLIPPYAMAHTKLEMELDALDLPAADRQEWAYEFRDSERLNVFLTNSLEEALSRSELLLGSYISQEANAAAAIKRETPIMVVIGNPPYSGHSANRGAWITNLVADYKRGVPGLDRPAQAKWLQDDYVKFLRFGQWRIDRTGAGILAFITNHAYLDNPTFRGMRRSLMESFSEIYILDLHGNSIRRERPPDGGIDRNVFDIQQGVAIGVFVRRPGHEGMARVWHADCWGVREDKDAWLAAHSVSSTEWELLEPDAPSYLFRPVDKALRTEYEHGWTVPEIMDQNGEAAPGIVTTQDQFAISWTAEEAKAKVRRFLATRDEAEARSLWQLCSQDQWNYQRAKTALRTDEWELEVCQILYRAFDTRWTVFNRHVAVHRRTRAMEHMLQPNLALVTVRQVAEQSFSHVLLSRSVVDNRATTSNRGIAFAFPLYLYRTEAAVGIWDAPEPARGGRRVNLSEDFLDAIARATGLTFVADPHGDLTSTFGPEDVLAYMIAVLQSPSYRSRYLAFLRGNFPRVPVPADGQFFADLVRLGCRIMPDLLAEGPTRAGEPSFPVVGSNVVAQGFPLYFAPGQSDRIAGAITAEGRIYVNRGDRRHGVAPQYFQAVAPTTWDFMVGGYQVAHRWLRERRGKELTARELRAYIRIVGALADLVTAGVAVDEAVEASGGWQLVFLGDTTDAEASGDATTAVVAPRA